MVCRQCFVSILWQLFQKVELGKVYLQLLVTTQRHHLELLLTPAVESQGSNLRDVNAETTVDACTVDADKRALRHRGPLRGGRA